MSILIWTGILIIALILQITVVPLFAIYGVKPDLLLMVVVSTGLLQGKEKGVGIGFFAGLLQDLAIGNLFGLNILSKLLTGYMFGLVERKVFKDHIFLPILAMAVATIFNSLVLLVVLGFWGYTIQPIPVLVNYILPLLGYNMVISVPIHQVVSRVLTIKRDPRF